MVSPPTPRITLPNNIKPKLSIIEDQTIMPCPRIGNKVNINIPFLTPMESIIKPPKNGMMIFGIAKVVYNKLNPRFPMSKFCSIVNYRAYGLSRQYVSPKLIMQAIIRANHLHQE